MLCHLNDLFSHGVVLMWFESGSCLLFCEMGRGTIDWPNTGHIKKISHADMQAQNHSNGQ